MDKFFKCSREGEKKAGNRLIDGERRRPRPDASKGSFFAFGILFDQCFLHKREDEPKAKMTNEFSSPLTHRLAEKNIQTCLPNANPHFGYNLIRKLELDCQLTLTLPSNDPTEGFSSFFYIISSYDRLSYLTDWVNF
ncbi:hypothetical protein T07_7137 [Trichinella nelsoni]|uniref:Uncharacterized protein n=1 Tax=Trichinella nelsoni TaxID=6336 RepID=A0A0V0RV73_9BILA|nr:hypothetical protein T07_7137 [Trichinella nelsoni]